MLTDSGSGGEKSKSVLNRMAILGRALPVKDIFKEFRKDNPEVFGDVPQPESSKLKSSKSKSQLVESEELKQDIVESASASNGANLSTNMSPSSRGLSVGSSNRRDSLDPADRPRDDDVLKLVPLVSASAASNASSGPLKLDLREVDLPSFDLHETNEMKELHGDSSQRKGRSLSSKTASEDAHEHDKHHKKRKSSAPSTPKHKKEKDEKDEKDENRERSSAPSTPKHKKRKDKDRDKSKKSNSAPSSRSNSRSDLRSATTPDPAQEAHDPVGRELFADVEARLYFSNPAKQGVVGITHETHSSDEEKCLSAKRVAEYFLATAISDSLIDIIIDCVELAGIELISSLASNLGWWPVVAITGVSPFIGGAVIMGLAHCCAGLLSKNPQHERLLEEDSEEKSTKIHDEFRKSLGALVASVGVDVVLAIINAVKSTRVLPKGLNIGLAVVKPFVGWFGTQALFKVCCKKEDNSDHAAAGKNGAGSLNF